MKAFRRNLGRTLRRSIAALAISAAMASFGEDPANAGPEPTAVWVGGEFEDPAWRHGGYEIAHSAGNGVNGACNLVIGESATIGATIALPANTYSKASILVKYEIPTNGAPVACAAIAGSVDTSTHAVGAICTVQNGTSLTGYWQNGSTGAMTTSGYGFENAPAVADGEGYLLYAYNSDGGTKVYVGSTMATLNGGANSGLKFSGRKIVTIAIGGPAVAGAAPWKGMVIKGVALFAGECLGKDDVQGYVFPAAHAPNDPDRYAVNPVAVWNKDFKTATKGGCTLSMSGTTAAADDLYGSKLTVGDASAVIDTSSSGNSGEVTVLVKYRSAPDTTNAAVATFGVNLSQYGVNLDVGAYTRYDKALAINRSWNGGNNKWVALETAVSLNADGGYLLCARKYNDMLVYAGDSLETMTGGSSAAPADIQFSCDLISRVGIGGGAIANANAAFTTFASFEVEKVAVFNGYYTPEQLAYVEIPEDGDVLTIAENATWNFAAGTTRTYSSIGTLASSGTIAVTNAASLAEGTYTLAEWTTPQQYTTAGAGYGKVGTLVAEGLPAGLSARLVYGARAIYLRVDDTAKQAARKPLVVWCYGDSITEGYNAQATGANYRILLYQKLEMLGYNVRSTGVYGLSNGHDSVDPTGTPLTDQYKWHSAKHGATAGPTTLAHRSNLSENVDTLCVQAGTPDVALLLIGVNDIPEWKNESDRVTPVFTPWTNVVARMVKNLPNTKIVVSTILYSDGTRTDLDPTIEAINTQITNLFENLPAAWQGRVLLADLNSIVKSGAPGIIYNDHLHPDWWGYDQMADGYLEKIVEAYPDPDATNFPSQAPIPAAPAANQLGAANKPELAAYRNGFTKLCNLRVEKGQNVGNVVYDDINTAAASNNLAKVGYFVEFVRADNHAHKWVWVDMDAFGDRDLASVGLPNRNFQQYVTGLHVYSNHGAIDNVAASDDTVRGWIEFSPYNYGNTQSITNDSALENYGNPFDWNDTLSVSGSYGCMQVFRVMSPSSKKLFERPQLMFAFNNFQSANGNPADFGIGNFAQHFDCNNSRHVADWTGVGATLAKMAPDQYSVKTIEIWTKEAHVVPGTATEIAMEQGNVELDASGDWAAIGARPIYLNLTLPTNAFTVAFDADIPEGCGTILSWDSQRDGTALDSRVRLTNDVAQMVVWRKADGTLATVGYAKATLIPSGKHKIALEWKHDVGAAVSVDGELFYSSGSLKFSGYDTSRIAIGGSALGSPDDVLTGLKVRNLALLAGRKSDSPDAEEAALTERQTALYRSLIKGTARRVSLNGCATSAAASARLADYFDLATAETNVVFAIAGIDMSNRTLTPTLIPPLKNGRLVLLGSDDLKAWRDLATPEAGGAVAFGDACRFFKFEIRDK